MVGNVWRNAFFISVFAYPCILFGIILDRANLGHGLSCGSQSTIHPLPPLLSLLSCLLFLLLHYLLLLFIKTKSKKQTKKTVRMRRVHVRHIINQIYFVWFISSLLIDKKNWQGIFSKKILEVILGRNLNATLGLKCS